MEFRDIDRFIHQYALERQSTHKTVALQHLLSHAYMVNSNKELDAFLHGFRTLVTLHIEQLNLFENPLRNAQFCWLIFFPIGFFYSLYLANLQDLVLIGLIYCAATMIYGTSLLVMVIRQWIDNDIRLGYYREIIEFIDSQKAT